MVRLVDVKLDLPTYNSVFEHSKSNVRLGLNNVRLFLGKVKLSLGSGLGRVRVRLGPN
jgi:hypothetical protein